MLHDHRPALQIVLPLTAPALAVLAILMAIVVATSFSNRNSFFLKDVDAAVKRLYTAISGKQKILIFGDYDVDGATSAALRPNQRRAKK